MRALTFNISTLLKYAMYTGVIILTCTTFTCSRKKAIQKNDDKISIFDEKGISKNLLDATDHDITGDNKPISRKQLDRFFNLCKEKNKIAYFPRGIYQFPEDYSFNFGESTFGLKGDGPGKTTFTTSADRNMRIPEKIDITKPILKDGVFKIDITGQAHRDYENLNLHRGDYLIIKNKKPDKATLAKIKSLHYLTELDLNQAEPKHDGLYVVTIVNFNWGGGFAHTALPWDSSVRVTMGSILEKSGNTWSRYHRSNGFIFYKEGYVEGIEFNNVSFFLFSPFGKNSNKNFILKNSKFSHCTRVFSLETSGGDADALVKGLHHKAGPHTPSFGGFSFNHFEISDCNFDHIHTSILWFTPYTKNWIIKNNLVKDCYSAITLFYYQISRTDEESDLHDGCLVENNTFINCRNYSKTFAIDKTLVRVQGKSKVINNRAIGCNGIHFYLSGSNNYAADNHIEPFNEYFQGNIGPIFWCKVRGLAGSTDIIERNTIIGGGKTCPVGHQKNANLIVRQNTFKTGTAWRYITRSTKDSLDKHYSYILYDDVSNIKHRGTRLSKKTKVQDRIYYSINESAWNPIGVKISEPAILWTPVEDNNYSITIEDNLIESDLIFRSSTNKYTLNNLKVINNRVYSSGLFLQCDDVKNVSIIDNPVLQFHGYTSGLLHSQNTLVVKNNIFQKSFLGILELSSEGSVEVDHNQFLSLPGFYTLDDFNLQSAKSRAVVLLKSESDQVTFSNNFVSLSQAKNTGLIIDKATKAIITGNSFDCTISQTNYKNRIPIAIQDEKNLSFLSIQDNKIQYKEKEELFIVSFDFEQSKNIDTVILKNNKVNQKESITRMNGSKCTIKNLKTNKKDNASIKFNGTIKKTVHTDN